MSDRVLEPERDFQRWLEGTANAAGALYYHVEDSRKDGVRGFPDTWIVTPSGLLLVAELKRADGHPSADQRLWLAQLAGVQRMHVGWFRPHQRGTLENLILGDRVKEGI